MTLFGLLLTPVFYVLVRRFPLRAASPVVSSPPVGKEVHGV